MAIDTKKLEQEFRDMYSDMEENRNHMANAKNLIDIVYRDLQKGENRGIGLTEGAAEICKHSGAKLVVHTTSEARRVSQMYGVEAIALSHMNPDLDGLRGPTVYDQGTFAYILNLVRAESISLIAENNRLKEELKTVTKELGLQRMANLGD